MPDDVLTLREVAEYLKVNERTIYRLLGGRKIPAFEVGGSWRFRLAEIGEWITPIPQSCAAQSSSSCCTTPA